MYQIINKVKYVDEYSQDNFDTDTLYIVQGNDQSLGLYFNNKPISNFEIVSKLSTDLSDNKFYVLRKNSVQSSIYYKKESSFILICSPEVEEVSFDNSSGLRFVVNDKSLRVLTLSDIGQFSVEDLNHLLSLKDLPEIDSRLRWSEINHG